MKHLIILFSLLCLYACSSSSCDEQEFNLIGTWELFEFCNYSGGIEASCPIQTPDQDEFFEFRTDSSFTLFIGGQLVNSGTFSVTNSRIDLIDDITGTLDYRSINPQGPCELNMNPLCEEGCRWSYQKINFID